MTFEMLKFLGETGKTILLQMYKRSWHEETRLSYWEMGFFLSIHKKIAVITEELHLWAQS